MFAICEMYTAVYAELYFLFCLRNGPRHIVPVFLSYGGGPPSALKSKCRRRFLSEMGVHSGYNSCLLKQKENSGRVTATFRENVHFLVGKPFSLEKDGVQVQSSYPQHVSNMFQQLLTRGLLWSARSSVTKCLKRKTISRKWRGTTPNSTPLLSLETPGFLLQKSYTEALS